MTAVLKDVPVTGLARSRAPAPPPADPRVATLERELSDAAVALAAARKQADAATRQAEREVAAAHARGVDEGRRQADDEGAALTALLTDALAAARRAWTERLDALEPLAVTLARAALAKVFLAGEPDTLVVATIARHGAALRAAGAVSLRIHPAIAPGLGDVGLDIVHDASLATGECLVALALGEADLSVERQWRRIDALLASLEAPR